MIFHFQGTLKLLQSFELWVCSFTSWHAWQASALKKEKKEDFLVSASTLNPGIGLYRYFMGIQTLVMESCRQVLFTYTNFTLFLSTLYAKNTNKITIQ